MRSTKPKALVSLYLLTLISAIIQSCCQEDFTITSEGSITSYNGIGTTQGLRLEKSDTITDYLKLVVYFKEYVAENVNYSLMANCLAMSCKEVWLNRIDESSMQLIADRQFISNGDTIPPGTDLLPFSVIGVSKNVVFNAIELNFYEQFAANTKVENGNCTFTFKARTDDNLNLEESKTVYFKY